MANDQAAAMDRTHERAAWDRIAPGYDRTNTPTQMALAREGLRWAAVSHGMRFLDVAAGSGALAIPAARLGARVVAVDQSPVMLQHLAARASQEGLEIETHVMDGHALALRDGSFDVVGSQFGVMLFPDMPKGISEMARVTKPGGRVLVLAYGDPHRIDFLNVFVTAVQSVRPDFTGPPEDPPPLEFQLADPARMREALVLAGLDDVNVRTVTESTEFPSGDALWDWVLGSNPIVECLLATLELAAEDRQTIRQALNRQVRLRMENGKPAVLSNPVNVGVGVKRLDNVAERS
jgi:ubiquinone/menaquinone biosynthesis C-methylase UbiE